MMTDPIADMLTRIRNASLIGKQEVLIPFSKFKFEIAKVLKHEDYIEGFEKVEDTTFPQIKVALKYDGKDSVIKSIKRVSKPGQRVYTKKEDVPSVLNNYGIAIISTSQGLMSNKEAKRKNVGGEIICEIW